MKLDGYTWQARVLPAVLLMLPIYVEANLIFVKLNFYLPLSVSVSNVLLTVLLVLMANWCRYFGRKAEKKLFILWDGAPTTRFLRENNDEYNAAQKSQLKSCLKILFSNIKMPSFKDEEKDKAKADEVYSAYVANLRALTRDTKKYPLVQAENRNYGMWRNLYGIKTISLLLNIILILVNIALMVFVPNILSVLEVVILSVCLTIYMLLWIVVISKSKVKDVAEVYAERLFEAVVNMYYSKYSSETEKEKNEPNNKKKN